MSSRILLLLFVWVKFLASAPLSKLSECSDFVFHIFSWNTFRFCVTTVDRSQSKWFLHYYFLLIICLTIRIVYTMHCFFLLNDVLPIVFVFFLGWLSKSYAFVGVSFCAFWSFYVFFVYTDGYTYCVVTFSLWILQWSLLA